jgi:hypothetical protein
MPTEPRKRPRAPKPTKPIIGWREYVALPDLKVPAIKAKIDTGARSSSLHAFEIERFRTGGVEMVRFTVHPRQRRRASTAPVEMPLLTEKLVRNPGGREEVRPVIRTMVVWNGISFEADLNLTRRDEMGFRMLLGRQAIRRRFLVDPGRSFLGAAPEEDAL